MTIPSAPPISAGIWPVITEHPKRLVVAAPGAPGYDDMSAREKMRRFQSRRKNGRWHIGIDLFGHDGDLVCAIADGVVVRNRGIYISGKRADGSIFKVRRIIVDHGGFLVGYGEVWPLGPALLTEEEKLFVGHMPNEGEPVHRGVPFARVTKMRVSSMLHLETWSKPPKPGRAGRWYRGEGPPEGLLDPTAMLLALAEDARRG